MTDNQIEEAESGAMVAGAEEIEKWEALVSFHGISAMKHEKVLEEHLLLIKFHIFKNHYSRY